MNIAPLPSPALRRATASAQRSIRDARSTPELHLPDPTGGLVALEELEGSLQTSRRFALSSKVGRTTVSSGLDEILLKHDRCGVTEIRPVDRIGCLPANRP